MMVESALVAGAFIVIILIVVGVDVFYGDKDED